MLVPRLWPFDIVPRILDAREWTQIEAGLKQRVRALNCFIDDVYHEQKIIKDKVVPENLLVSAFFVAKPIYGKPSMAAIQ